MTELASSGGLSAEAARFGTILAAFWPTRRGTSHSWVAVVPNNTIPSCQSRRFLLCPWLVWRPHPATCGFG